ncbi:MAG: oligosaccharide repeat unit polymerase [Bacteroidetes bacterium]|nr:oligosaccharide repeat unit polymerase [Bacteroidota bacterium]
MAISPTFLFLLGLFLAFVGKRAFGRWFNPVSVYSGIWGVMLGMHELKLLKYTDMHTYTWLLIFASWGMFLFGGYTALHSQGKKDQQSPSEVAVDERLLAKWILILCAIGTIGVVQHWMVLIRNFGSISSAIVLGSIVYSARIHGELPGMMPYVADTILAAVSLAGVYFAKRRKVGLVVIIPMVLASVESMAWMGRAKIIISGILIFSAFSFTTLSGTRAKYTKKGKWSIIISSVVVVLIVAIASEGILSMRKSTEKFYGASQTLNKLHGVPFLTPSIYVYLSGQVAVLDKFLQYEMDGTGEKLVFGENTFAPVFRVVSKLLGGGDYVSAYQRFYMVPVALNTGTYLRELYVDFGELGPLIFPYILGFVASLLYIEIKRRPKLWKIVLLAHIFVIIVFSFMMQAMRWGYWWDSVIISLVVARILERNTSLTKIQETSSMSGEA